MGKRVYKFTAINLDELRSCLQTPDENGEFVLESLPQCDRIMKRVVAFLEAKNAKIAGGK